MPFTINSYWFVDMNTISGIVTVDTTVYEFTASLTPIGSGGSEDGTQVWSIALSSNTTNANAQSIRNLHPSISAGGQQVRLHIAGSTAAATSAERVAVGISSGSGSNTSATPVELTFGGFAGFSLAAGGTIVSDWADLTTSVGNNLISIFDMAAGTQGMRYGGVTGAHAFAKDSTDSYNQSSVTGFTQINNRTYFVTSIEVRNTPT